MSRLSPTRVLTARAAQVVLGILTAFVALFAGPLAPMANATYYYPVSLSSFDSRLLSDMNNARVAAGLPKLIEVAGPTDVAHAWSCKMASAKAISHNPYLYSQLRSHGMTAYATTYGENVGVDYSGASADNLFTAYWNSPEHKANILTRAYTFVGVHTKVANGWEWNVVDFFGTGASAYTNSYGYTKVTC